MEEFCGVKIDSSYLELYIDAEVDSILNTLPFG